MGQPLEAIIAGTGSYAPPEVMDNDYFASYLDTSAEWIVPRTGILTRHRVGKDETTATMAKAATERALKDAGMDVSELDHIIVGTVTADRPLPSAACILQNLLGISEIPAWDLQAACSGLIYGMVMAGSLIQSGLYKNILVIGAETLTRITDYEDRNTAVLFGDAAGAVIMQPSTDPSRCILHHHIGSDGSKYDYVWIPGGGSAEPASQKTVNERLHYMKMRGRELFKFAVGRMEASIDRALEETGIKADDLKLIIPHQSNFRIIESCRKRLKLPREKMLINVDRYGNTSTASIGLGLDEARRTGRLNQGDLVMLLAVGGGMTWGAMIIRL
ncbi:MAG: ketoacyl-ACP synthase III [Phycisphaerae bacterium]|nr:ketoacyl-ACP synthase III [Phycisphaerae bacterium]